MKKRVVMRAVCLIVALLMLSMQTAMGNPVNEKAERKSEQDCDINWIYANGTLVSSKVKTVLWEESEREFLVDAYVVATSNQIVGENLGLRTSIDDSVWVHEITTYEIWRERAANGSGSSSYQDYDASYSFLFALTVNYTDTIYNGETYRQMTTISGSYTIEDYQMDVVSQSYTLAQMGKDLNGAKKSVRRTYQIADWLTSWEVDSPTSTFPAISMNWTDAFQAARYSYTIERTPTGSTWSGYIDVYTFGGQTGGSS